MYTARELAIQRMVAEATQLNADGIVGVDLTIVPYAGGGDVLEFVAVGTAVRCDKAPGTFRAASGQPFSSGLSGRDFFKLLHYGWAPTGLVMGTCVYHVAHQSIRAAMRQFGQNVEIPLYTQAVYTARELAMSRMQEEGERNGAAGIVGVSVKQYTTSGVSTAWSSSPSEPGFARWPRRPAAPCPSWCPSRRGSACGAGPAGAGLRGLLHKHASSTYNPATMAVRRIRAAVCGATGYMGAQCVEILDRHPTFELTGLYGRSSAGRPYAASVPGSRLTMEVRDGLDVGDAEVVFAALPIPWPPPTPGNGWGRARWSST